MGNRRSIASLLWTCALIAVIDGQEGHTDSDLTTESLVTTEDPVNQLYFDEGFYRTIIRSTGKQCYTDIKELGLPLHQYEKLCLCIYFCLHRLMTPEEMVLHNSIIASLNEVVVTGRLQSKWPYISAYLTLSVLGMIGNVIILLAVTLCIARPSVINVMITSLAIADFFVLAFCAPFQTYATGWSTWVLGAEVCKIMWYIYYACFGVSVFTMVVMAFERYLVICHPMKAQIWSSVGRAKKTAAGIWLLGAITAIPAAFAYGHSSGESTCGILWMGHYVLYLMSYLAIAIFGIPTVVMTAAYIQIGATLYKSIAVRRKLKHSGGKESEGSDDRIQVIRLLMSMLVLFVLCWGPNFIATVFWLANEDQRLFGALNFEQGKSVVQGLTILSYANSMLNPFLYMLTSKQYRGAVVILFKACKSRQLPDKRQLGATVATVETSLASGQHKAPRV